MGIYIYFFFCWFSVCSVWSAWTLNPKWGKALTVHWFLFRISKGLFMLSWSRMLRVWDFLRNSDGVNCNTKGLFIYLLGSYNALYTHIWNNAYYTWPLFGSRVALVGGLSTFITLCHHLERLESKERAKKKAFYWERDMRLCALLYQKKSTTLHSLTTITLRN